MLLPVPQLLWHRLAASVLQRKVHSKAKQSSVSPQQNASPSSPALLPQLPPSVHRPGGQNERSLPSCSFWSRPKSLYVVSCEIYELPGFTRASLFCAISYGFRICLPRPPLPCVSDNCLHMEGFLLVALRRDLLLFPFLR